MVARNEFRAFRLVELTLLMLLLLSSLEETHAVDSTLQNKLRGKDNDLLVNLLPEDESIDSSVIHLPAESDSIGLTSDQSFSMTLTSDTGKPNGEGCSFDYQCESGRCAADYQCENGKCYNTWKCEDLAPNGEGCLKNDDCESGYCGGSLGSYTCQDGEAPSSCFSSTSMVNHMNHGFVPISDINIGDYIQSDIDGSFSSVYAFKKNNHEDTEFYQLHSRTGTLLEVTDRHLVYLKNKSLPIAARDVRIGDVLKSGNPEDDTEVVKIEVIHREGYYNPFTESGTFVLNEGVVASSYDVSSSSSSDFFDGPTEMLHWHTLAHFACAPLRFVCKTMNFDVCSDADNQNEDGLHKFIVFLTTLRKLKYWQQVAVLPVIFGAGVLCTLLEFFYDLVGEVFYETASQDDGSFGFLFTFSLTVAALVPSAIFLWRKKHHLS